MLTEQASWGGGDWHLLAAADIRFRTEAAARRMSKCQGPVLGYRGLGGPVADTGKVSVGNTQR
jgi:hypothetical protein